MLIKQLERHEGFRGKPYHDSVGKLTIGIGRNLDDVGISRTEAYHLLENDVEKARSELSRYDWYKGLDRVRQDTVTNMVFNMGLPSFLGFKKTIAAIKEERFADAAKEMLDSKWADQVGYRATELAYQMRTGKYHHSLDA